MGQTRASGAFASAAIAGGMMSGAGHRAGASCVGIGAGSDSGSVRGGAGGGRARPSSPRGFDADGPRASARRTPRTGGVGFASASASAPVAALLELGVSSRARLELAPMEVHGRVARRAGDARRVGSSSRYDYDTRTSTRIINYSEQRVHVQLYEYEDKYKHICGVYN